MKKIIAILLALAVVSMAFAQTVSIQNTVETEPSITIDGGTHYWGFANDKTLREQVVGEAITADGRAKVKGRIRFDVQTLDPNETSILSAKPRWSWNSSANAADGNRSSVAALLRPFDFLEIGVGNLDDVGYAFGVGPSLDGTYWSTPFKYGYNTITALAGTWQGANELIKDGIQVSYIGLDDHLKVGLGLSSARNEENGWAGTNRETMIKKGMFNGLALAAKYDAELFSVGAKWSGNFGTERHGGKSVSLDRTGKYENADADLLAVVNSGKLPANWSSISYSTMSTGKAEESDKAYQEHQIYAGFEFKGLQDAKIGTTLNAAVGFFTEKASAIANGSTPKTSWLFGVGAGFNFRNGIKDNVSFAVGYQKLGSTTSKVLPFCVRNNISYSVSSDATFSFDLCYAQAGLSEKKSVKASSNTGSGYYVNAGDLTTINADKNGMTKTYANTPTTNGGYGWLLAAKPNFSFNIGAHSWSIGVSTVVLGDIVPHAKSGHEWGWTGLRGIEADVSFPISWTYTF